MQHVPSQHEAFLIIEQPRQRLSHWIQMLAPLGGERLEAITAHYDPATDHALLGLGDVGVAPPLALLRELARLAEIELITEVDASLAERLARCTLQVSDEHSVTGALCELVRRIRRATAVQVKPPGVWLAMLSRRSVRQHPTWEMSPIEKPLESAQHDVALPPVAPPENVRARYLRGGSWAALRIEALSAGGATLVANALPRLHDHVHVELSFREHRAFVRGLVNKLSTSLETQRTGLTTFDVRFDVDEVSRSQLMSLLEAVRAANVVLDPPPSRQARRYSVEWPFYVDTPRGAARSEALDISREGMFVRVGKPLSLALDADPTTHVSFSATLDDRLTPIRGRANVVRRITDAEARACGLAAGYGLHIGEMSDDDRARWEAFLGRVERRAQKRVLIGAAPLRLSEMQLSLASAGYSVSGSTDAGALVEIVRRESRPVDATIIDGQWLTPATSATWMESVFAARNVPCLTVRGDGHRARLLVDQLLAVV